MAALEEVAIAIGYRGDPVARAVARVALALAKALAKHDISALEKKGGPESWARSYGSRYEEALPFIGAGKNRRGDLPSFLRTLVVWFETCEHVTDADRAFWVTGVLVMNEAIIGPSKSKEPEAMQHAIECQLATVAECSGTPLQRATRRSRAAMRGWGWSAKQVDDAFNKV